MRFKVAAKFTGLQTEVVGFVDMSKVNPSLFNALWRQN